jgi:U3 small nucleolar RNA-associated protein 21
MHKVLELKGHTKPLIKFVSFGDFLFSLAEEGEFIVFNRMKGTLVKKITFETNFDNFLHPTTYINKLLFSGGSEVQLWNIMTEEKLFTFQDTVSPIGNVTCMEQSPVVDIVALGFEDGTILLLNLLYNQVLLQFSQSADGGPIKRLSFSSDLSLGVSLLASVTQSREGG